MMKVTALAGGVGGAKLLVGLQAVAGTGLTAVVNTGDDAEIYGVYVSPDVDICTYWLAGIADSDRGWGISGDGFAALGQMRTLGVDTWFSLGDRDLGTCLARTLHLRAGGTLSAFTRRTATALGVAATVLPMSDDPVRTRIVTADGRTLEFQEYFVRERTEPEVAGIVFAGADSARPAPGVLEAIASAELVVVCPSNPLVSIGPILALPGMRDALAAHPHVVAVSPIVRGAALKGPADRMLAAMGTGASASAVARLYADFIDVFVVDSSDPEEVAKVEATGVAAVTLPTVMRGRSDSEALARALLGLAPSGRPR